MANGLEEWAHHAAAVTDHQCSHLGGRFHYATGLPDQEGSRKILMGLRSWALTLPLGFTSSLHTWKTCQDLWAPHPPLTHALPPFPPKSASTGPSQRLPTGCSSVECATACILVSHSQFTSPLRRLLLRDPAEATLSEVSFHQPTPLNASHCLRS